MRALRPRRTGRSSDAQRPQCCGRGGRHHDHQQKGRTQHQRDHGSQQTGGARIQQLSDPSPYTDVIMEAYSATPALRAEYQRLQPYMAPVPLRGKRNEPAFVAYTARRVAELRGMDEDALADAAFENGCRLFGIR